MRKISKKILLTTLGITSFAIATPLILTSCGDNTNNTQGGGSTNPDTPSGQKITPTLNANFEVIGTIESLFDVQGNLVDVGNLFTKMVKENPSLKSKVISNYSSFTKEQQDSLVVQITTNKQTDIQWGGTTSYESWGATANEVVYYSIGSQQLDVSSPKDLKNQLTAEKLKQIMTEIGSSNAPEPNATYALESNSQIAFDAKKDYVNIHVKETFNSTTKDINLRIPVSDLNLVLKNATVNVTSSDSNVLPTTATLALDYNVGIDPTVHLIPEFSHDIQVDADSQINDVNAVLEKLGFMKYNRVNKASSSEVSLKSATTPSLDNEKIGETTQVFNTQFSNPNLKKNNGKYSLSFDAVPTNGHYWVDGTTTSRKVSINNLNITSKNLPQDATFKSTVDYVGTGSPTGPASLEKFKAWWTSVPTGNQPDQTVASGYLQILIPQLEQSTEGFANVTLTYAGDNNIGWDSSRNMPTIKLTVSPKENHAFKDDVPGAKEVVVTLTGLNWKN
ncbi:P35 family lipoprotein [Malacoplasma muris]|uniref:P35 family lipoprotein n=1 Tax=Malacoplasma muris TaxID=2119 RepID=UPI00398ED368